MNTIVKILMERDSLSETEAENYFDTVREDILAADNYFEAEDIMLHDLGLEMDYLFDLI